MLWMTAILIYDGFSSMTKETENIWMWVALLGIWLYKYACMLYCFYKKTNVFVCATQVIRSLGYVYIHFKGQIVFFVETGGLSSSNQSVIMLAKSFYFFNFVELYITYVNNKIYYCLYLNDNMLIDTVKLRKVKFLSYTVIQNTVISC